LRPSAFGSEAKASAAPLLATGAIWVLFAVVLEQESARAQLAAARAVAQTLDTTHQVGWQRWCCAVFFFSFFRAAFVVSGDF
jgi:hypothetical protein